MQRSYFFLSFSFIFRPEYIPILTDAHVILTIGAHVPQTMAALKDIAGHIVGSTITVGSGAILQREGLLIGTTSGAQRKANAAPVGTVQELAASCRERCKKYLWDPPAFREFFVGGGILFKEGW